MRGNKSSLTAQELRENILVAEAYSVGVQLAPAQRKIYITPLQLGVLFVLALVLYYKHYPITNILFAELGIVVTTAAAALSVHNSLRQKLLAAISKYNFNEIDRILRSRKDVSLGTQTKYDISIDDLKYWRMAQVLFARGVDINFRDRDGKTPLMHLARYANNHQKTTDLIAAIINKNADVVIRDNDGNTALMHAMRKDNLKAIQALLPNKNESVNIVNNEGNSPIMHLLNGLIKDQKVSREKSIISWLVENGADVNRQDKNGNTALMHLLANGNIAEALNNNRGLIKLFKERGLNFEIKNKDGKTFIEIAQEGNNQFILALDFLQVVPQLAVAQPSPSMARAEKEILNLMPWPDELLSKSPQRGVRSEGFKKRTEELIKEQRDKQRRLKEEQEIDKQRLKEEQEADRQRLKEGRKMEWTKLKKEKAALEMIEREANIKKQELEKQKRSAEDAEQKSRLAEEQREKIKKKCAESWQIDQTEPLSGVVNSITAFLSPLQSKINGSKITEIVFKGSALYRYYLPDTFESSAPRDIDLEMVFSGLRDIKDPENLKKQICDLFFIANGADLKNFKIWRGDFIKSNSDEVWNVEFILEDKLSLPINIIIRNDRRPNPPEKDWLANFDALRMVFYKKDSVALGEVPKLSVCSDLRESEKEVIADIKKGKIIFNERNLLNPQKREKYNQYIGVSRKESSAGLSLPSHLVRFAQSSQPISLAPETSLAQR